jgi:hypothetical protein
MPEDLFAVQGIVAKHLDAHVRARRAWRTFLHFYSWQVTAIGYSKIHSRTSHLVVAGRNLHVVPERKERLERTAGPASLIASDENIAAVQFTVADGARKPQSRDFAQFFRRRFSRCVVPFRGDTAGNMRHCGFLSTPTGRGALARAVSRALAALDSAAREWR